jgi:hypothetical protein
MGLAFELIIPARLVIKKRGFPVRRAGMKSFSVEDFDGAKD